MENMTYVPSSDMLKEDAFKDFPASAENVFARNLIWDMGDNRRLCVATIPIPLS